MVSRILEQREAIRVVLGEDRNTSHLVPSWQDVDVLECIDKVTKPLKDITDLLSGEKQVTSSAVKPLLSVINSTMLDVKDTDTPLTKEIKMAIGTDLNNRYSLSNVLLDQCSFVDPRFKQLYCTSDESVKLVISEMESIVSNNEESASVSDDSAPPTNKGKFSKIFGTVTLPSSTSESMSPTQKVMLKIETYMQYQTLHIDQCPLEWWKIEAHRMPVLSKVARKYLCICDSSVASERMFSKGGNIVTAKRNGLKPEMWNV